MTAGKDQATVTQAQVAGLAQVTQRTVSRCFADPEQVAPATRERILKVAKEIGYRPNTAAVSMRTGVFGSVALLNDAVGWRTFLPQDLIRGIARFQQDQDRRLLHVELPDQAFRDPSALPALFRQHLVDGLIVNYHGRLPAGLTRKVGELKLPTTWVNCKRSHDAIMVDETATMHRIMDILLARGYRGVVFCDPDYHAQQEHGLHYSRSDRLEVYRQRMAAADLPCCEILPRRQPASAQDRAALVRSALAAAQRPTAFLSASRMEAMLAMRIGEYELGLRLPENLTTVDFEEAIPGWDRPLSGASVTWMEIGAQASRQLDRLIAGDIGRFPSIALERRLWGLLASWGAAA